MARFSSSRNCQRNVGASRSKVSSFLEPPSLTVTVSVFPGNVHRLDDAGRRRHPGGRWAGIGAPGVYPADTLVAHDLIVDFQLQCHLHARFQPQGVDADALPSRNSGANRSPESLLSSAAVRSLGSMAMKASMKPLIQRARAPGRRRRAARVASLATWSMVLAASHAAAAPC